MQGIFRSGNLNHTSHVKTGLRAMRSLAREYRHPTQVNHEKTNGIFGGGNSFKREGNQLRLTQSTDSTASSNVVYKEQNDNGTVKHNLDWSHWDWGNRCVSRFTAVSDGTDLNRLTMIESSIEIEGSIENVIRPPKDSVGRIMLSLAACPLRFDRHALLARRYEFTSELQSVSRWNEFDEATMHWSAFEGSSLSFYELQRVRFRRYEMEKPASPPLLDLRGQTDLGEVVTVQFTLTHHHASALPAGVTSSDIDLIYSPFYAAANAMIHGHLPWAVFLDEAPQANGTLFA